MRTTFALAFALATALAAAPVVADDAAAPRYVALVNRSLASITAVAVAPRGSEAFRDIALARPLAGGGAGTTLAIATTACSNDVRVTFRDGRTRVYRDLDLCGKPRLAIERSPRGAMLPGESLAATTAR